MRGIVFLVSLVVLGSTVASAQTTPDGHGENHGQAAPNAPSAPDASRRRATERAQSHAGRSHGAPSRKPGEESLVNYFWRKSDEAFHDGDYERAVGLHKAIVAADPGDVESYGVAAWLMWSLGRGEEAIAHLRRGVKANPANWDMWDELAQNYELQKRRPEAFDAYKRAAALVPQDADPNDAQLLRRRLAHAAEKSGDLQTAVETWRSLVKDYPNEPVNKNNLARVEKAIADAGADGAAQATALRSTAMIVVPGFMAAAAIRVLRARRHAGHTADSAGA